MVLTRGHKEDETGDKSPLPQRECRRSNRGNLQEPVDDIIYESDEHSPIKPKKSSKENNISTDQNRKILNSEAKEKEVEESSKESEESESDRDLFVQEQSFTRNSRRSSRKRRSAISSDFTLTIDDISDVIEKSDHENGLRRSLRKRKFTSKSSESWLVGPKTLRGYPNIVNSSEAENDEPRAAQKSRRFNREKSKNTIPQRQFQQFRQLRDNNNRYIHSERNHQSGRVQRNTRYSRQFHNNDFEDDCKKELKEETDELGSTPQMNKSQKKIFTRPRRNHAMKVQYDEDSNSYENIYPRRYISRRAPSARHLRSTSEGIQQKVEPISESENSPKDEKSLGEQEKENTDREENSKKLAGNGRQSNLNDFQNGSLLYDLPSKRKRKPVSRLTYDAEPNHRQKITSSASSSSSESTDDNREESACMGRSRYPLRQNRSNNSMKDPYEAIPSHRHKHNISLSNYLHSPARKYVFNRKQKATHARDDTSSSSDEKAFEKRKGKSMNKARNRCMPVNMKPEDLQMAGMRERKVGSSLADIDPMSMDTSITFDSIGGLAQHIKALKEMILFPIMYPEVFQKFGVNPPRGVLFYGPPGTGKTLVARALANECSHDDRKIAFFMRKGADCLSKWVGESERQLRLLFDQAYQMRPSIIFFDEIDGLAPVRSSRQDQIHSSIVSTLLALLDGIDSRGEIVVIGATNRIDAIDPALRRPGRFDREFHFPLPSIEARKEILKINTSCWIPKPTAVLLNFLSEQTVGYCGADLKSLCGEAALIALRTKYPQIYSSKQKLLLDVSSIAIKSKHFKHCINKIVPAGQRATNAPGRKLNCVFEPLLKDSLKQSLSVLKKSFPQGFFKVVLNRVLHRPRLLLVGDKNQGQTSLLAPAILHALERIPTHRLDFPSLFSLAARAPEEACAQIFHEAKRNVPSILYVPLIDHLWSSSSESVKSTFLYLLNDLESSVPVLFLATVENQYSELEPEIRQMFSSYREEIFTMCNPSREQRSQFFNTIFHTKILSKPVPLIQKRVLEVLPLAPPPEPRKMKQEEVQKLEYVEEASLRELRIFLRQICSKLAKNKMFYIFTKPVDLEEVTDYLQIITKPMDLETMMSKIDLHQYACAQDFLKDIEQIVANALEYNPDRFPEDKIIRHRACTLRDTAYAYIKAEMDTDFEEKCKDIRNNRKKRKYSQSSLPPHFLASSQTVDDRLLLTSAEVPKTIENMKHVEDEIKSTTSSKKRKRRSNWSRGMVTSKRKKIDKDKCEIQMKEEEENDDSTGRIDDDKIDNSTNKATNSNPVLLNGQLSTDDSNQGNNQVTSLQDSCHSQSMHDSFTEEIADLKTGSVADCNNAESLSEEGSTVPIVTKEITVDLCWLEELYQLCITSTEDVSVEELHHLYSKLAAMCKKYRMSFDRNTLLSEIECELQRFQEYRAEAH